MGLFSNLAKAGLAKKAMDVARKPENQAKAKSAFASARSKAGSRRGGAAQPAQGRRFRGGGAPAGGRRARVTSRRAGAPRR